MPGKKLHILSVLFLLIITAVIILESCKKREVDVNSTRFRLPAGWPQPNLILSAADQKEETFQLGRKLFYERNLSKDRGYPCASCHEPFASFTTYQHDRSHGYNNSHTLRNAPGLVNIAWLDNLFWDGSQDHLNVSLTHITRSNEMGEHIDTVLQKLRNDTSYIRMFRSAFGDDQVTSFRLLKALQIFVAHIITDNSKYDQVMRKEASFTAAEQNGYLIFKAKCAACHKEPLFTDNSYRNTGLAIDPALNDYGRMSITGNKNDSLRFRVPSLRNVMLTSYYNHDGRFSEIKQVLQHYVSGVQKSATLDPLLNNGISLTAEEINLLISFLSTLTDASVTTHPRFSKP